MEKRLIIAIGLSFLVAWAWSGIMPKPAPVSKIESEVGKVSVPSVAPPSTVIPETKFTDVQGEKIRMDNLSIEVVEAIAAIKNVEFEKYNNDNLLLFNGLQINDPLLTFKKNKQYLNRLEYVHSDENKKIYKRFIFSNNSYAIQLEVEIENLTGKPIIYNLPLFLGILDNVKDAGQAQFHDVFVGTNEKTLHSSAKKPAIFDNLKYIGLRNKYFCAIIQPENGQFQGKVSKIDNNATDISLTTNLTIPANGKILQKFSIYLGPQELNIIKSVNPEWTGIIHYGMFDLIAQVLVQMIIWINGVFHNWGVAIILLTLVVQIVLYPLTLKQVRSMKEMQAVQPKVEQIRKTYKDNPQKMNKEIMELYKEHKVNPFGGCLPMLLQMPIFIALFNMQNRLIFLKNASFLWIKDLSQPDKLFVMPGTLPVVGKDFSINVLPLVAIAIMFFQQKMTMAKVSGEGAEQQKIMAIMMPVMMLVFFYKATAAFNLYMLVNFGFMLAQTMLGNTYGAKKEH